MNTIPFKDVKSSAKYITVFLIDFNIAKF